LTSGLFAAPVPESTEIAYASDPKYRLQPRMFKHVIGGDHVEFQTGQQQDAAQFLLYMLEKLDDAEKLAFDSKRMNKVGGETSFASNLFAFKTMDRLVCSADSRVLYTESATETILSMAIPMEKAAVIEVKEAPDHKRQKVDGKREEEKRKRKSLCQQFLFTHALILGQVKRQWRIFASLICSIEDKRTIGRRRACSGGRNETNLQR
jgi:ubiquitin carboxyl-terminal hydrolase 5/13